MTPLSHQVGEGLGVRGSGTTTTSPCPVRSESAVSLVVTLVVIFVASAIVLWGLSLFLQGYLYSEPADKLILRAAVGGLAIACYLSFWVYVNTRADRPNKYGAIHQFSPVALSKSTTFQAVQKYRKAGGEAREETVAYQKQTGQRGEVFVSNTDATPFKLNTADYITSAIIVTEGQPAPVRFEAVLKPDGWTYDGEKKTFREKGGPRFIEGDDPGVIVAPSGGTQLVAIALNVLVFVVLFAVFWPVLQYGVGHAIGLSLVIGLVIIILLMPMLFDLNTLPTVPVAPPTPATRA